MKSTQLQLPQADEISTLIPYAVLAPSGHNTQPWYFRVANNSIGLYADRDQAANLVSEGDAMQWANPGWRRELAAWMHPRRKGDGLTVPWIAAPFAQAVVRTFDMGNGIGAKDRELAEQLPVLAVLGTKRDAAGRAVESWR